MIAGGPTTRQTTSPHSFFYLYLSQALNNILNPTLNLVQSNTNIVTNAKEVITLPRPQEQENFLQSTTTQLDG